MTAMTDPMFLELEAQFVVARAADAGFRLACYETETGQAVWEWRRGTEPRPQFITRRVALHWMSEFLTAQGPSPSTA